MGVVTVVLVAAAILTVVAGGSGGGAVGWGVSVSGEGVTGALGVVEIRANH